MPYGDAHILPNSALEMRLGNSGIKVSKIILGCMSYGSPEWHGWNTSSLRHYDAGINAFDTAAVYSDGMSEEILGKAIKEYALPRDEIVVMTKVFGYAAWNKPTEAQGARTTNQRGLSRKHIFDSVKNSLERLQLDNIDLLQCHRFDNNTPIEETMQVLHDVVKAGHVRYIGMSSCWAWQFNVMQNYAITHELTPFISMQNHHSLLYREEEREMFPSVKHFGVGVIPWSPLARGMLTRPMAEQKETARGTDDPFIGGYNKGASADIVGRVEELAKKRGVSMAQIALAWSIGSDGVTAPIIGTTSLEKITDSIAAIHLKLTPEEMRFLEEPYRPLPVYGHS
ncbi:aryl-alcohol dehydrogenase [Mycena vulgaris]|nr:aryl-alcohol dehydrogenase [Mycena vulgaris]